MLKEPFWNCNCVRLRGIEHRNFQASEFKFEIPSVVTFAINSPTTLPVRVQHSCRRDGFLNIKTSFIYSITYLF